MIKLILGFFRFREKVQAINPDISEPVVSILKAMGEYKRFKFKTDLGEYYSKLASTEPWGYSSLNLELIDTKTDVSFGISVPMATVKLLWVDAVKYVPYIVGSEEYEDNKPNISLYYENSPFTFAERKALESKVQELYINYRKRLYKATHRHEERWRKQQVIKQQKDYQESRQKLMEVYCND